MASLLLPVKMGILSLSVVCAAVVLKLSLPSVTSFAYSETPSFYYSIAMTWLRPPYLYVIINGIIITIVATSKLHHRNTSPDSFFTDENDVVAAVKVVVPEEYVVVGYEEDEETKVMMTSSERDVVDKVMIETMNNVVVGDDDDVAVSEKTNTSTERNSSQFFVVSRCSDKPPVSVRTGHRKSAKSTSQDGRKLRVSKPKRQETLETTWKTITEGRSMPLNRYLRKSDSWESNGHHLPQDPDPKMTKSDTFHDSRDRHVSTVSPPESLGRLRKEPSGSWKLKKDPSLSQDDLNRRVEAFINKFNEEMRLQRQESLNQYMQMINRGAL